MTRIINSGGHTVFMVSKIRAFLFLAIEVALLYWLITILQEKDLSLDAIFSHRHTGFLLIVTVALILVTIMTLAMAIFEKAYSLKLDPDKMTVHSFFSTYVWHWKDIDRIHLGKSQKTPPFLETALMQTLMTKVLKIVPLYLRFEDVLLNQGKTKRLAFRPEPDGYVSLPLALFGNAEEIFKTADHYHLEWHQRHNRQ